MRARDIMSRPAVTISSRATGRHAAELLAQYGIHSLPVIDDAGHLVGTISDSELIRNHFAAEESPLGGGAGHAADRPAHLLRDIMNRSTEAVDPSASLTSVADLLTTTGRLIIPVVDARKVVGVVTARDLIASEFSGRRGPSEPSPVA